MHQNQSTRYERDTPLPPAESFVDRIEVSPELQQLIRQEIARVQRMETQMIPLFLDPLCAFYLVSALQLALSHPGIAHAPEGREVMEEVARGIEARIEEQCPEMAKLLAEGRRERGI